MRIPVAFAAVLAAAPASAESIPRFDVEAYCEQVSTAVGGSYEIKRTCIQQEQMAYDALKAAWPSIPERTASYCEDVGRAVGGTYEIMRTCIQQESGAASDMPEFRY